MAGFLHALVLNLVRLAICGRNVLQLLRNLLFCEIAMQIHVLEVRQLCLIWIVDLSCVL